ncbi:MAG: MATE family efflux transporter [Ruminococcaceae bacterium]|nr:MATE family efflux transporter [Oscillospiraceae bacterium]
MMKIKDKYFYKTFFSLFFVVALQNIIVFSVNLADSIMLGSYSEIAMSGVSLANQIQFLLHMFVNGAANGLVVISSQYWGKKHIEPIKKVFAAAFWAGTLMSLILMITVLISPEGILGILSDEKEIVLEGARYIKLMAFSYVIFAVTNILIALMRSVEAVRIGFYTSVLALIFNISLNYCLIFGHFGFPEMGVEGAAVATIASRAAEFIAVTVYVFVIDKRLRLKLRDIFALERTYINDYIKAGLPLIGSGGSWGVAMTVQTAIIGRLGAAAIGANAVAAPVFQVVSVLYTSSGNASSVLIGKTVGENDIPRVKKYSKKLQIMYLVIGALSSISLLLLRDIIISFYDVTEETAALSAVFINILSVTVIGSAYEAPCLCGIVSGGGDTKFVFKNDILFMWCMVLPLSFLSAFVFNWPVPVTFFILKSDQITKCIVAVFKVNRFRWIKNLTRENEEKVS